MQFLQLVMVVIIKVHFIIMHYGLIKKKVMFGVIQLD